MRSRDWNFHAQVLQLSLGESSAWSLRSCVWTLMLISCKKMTKEKREEEEKKSPTRYHARSKKKLVSLAWILLKCYRLIIIIIVIKTI